VPELRGDPPSSSRVRMREQPIWRVHAVEFGDGGRIDPTAGERLWDAGVRGRRQRRLCCSGSDPQRSRKGADRQRAHAARLRDIQAQRPFPPRRSSALQTTNRSRFLARARPARVARTKHRRPDQTRIRNEVATQIAAALELARTGPLPDPQNPASATKEALWPS
jgi:hypothetical protein